MTMSAIGAKPSPLILMCGSAGSTQAALSSEVYDYTAIPQAVDAVIAQGHIDLQETLVDAIAAKLLCDPRLLAVQIASCKREAMLDAEGVGVEVFRCQNSLKDPS